MTTHTSRRLGSMAENIQTIVGMEFLLAAQTCDFHAPHKCSPPVQKARDLLRSHVAFLEEDRYLKPDIAIVQKMWMNHV